MPGRAADIRPANKKELEATTVVAGAPLPDPDLEAGIELPITAEVTGQIWKRDDYDPWSTAQRCHDLMREARDRAAAD